MRTVELWQPSVGMLFLALSIVGVRPLAVPQTKDVAAASKAGEEYLGPTPFSDLVCSRSDIVIQEFDGLIGEPLDVSTWTPVLTYIAAHRQEDLREEALCLAGSLVCLLRANWNFRVTNRLQCYPWCLLKVLETPCGEACASRQLIARRLLDAEPCCLVSNESDVALKLRAAFFAEWAVVADGDGRCPLRLWQFMLLFRAGITMDVQEVEGMNSLVQSMSKHAPSIGLPLASDRMQIKKGIDISPSECTDLHGDVVRAMESDETTQRFLPVVASHSPDEAVAHSCPHRPEVSPMAARIALGCFKQKVVGNMAVWMLKNRIPGPAFTMCWTYHYKIFCMMGAVCMDDSGVLIFEFDVPLACRLLQHLISEDDRVAAAPRSFRIFRRFATWNTSVRRATLSATASHVDVKPAARRRPPAAPGAAAAAAAAPPHGGLPAGEGPPPLAGHDASGEESEDEFDLEMALAQMLEEDAGMDVDAAVDPVPWQPGDPDSEAEECCNPLV